MFFISILAKSAKKLLFNILSFLLKILLIVSLSSYEFYNGQWADIRRETGAIPVVVSGESSPEVTLLVYTLKILNPPRSFTYIFNHQCLSFDILQVWIYPHTPKVFWVTRELHFCRDPTKELVWIVPFIISYNI